MAWPEGYIAVDWGTTNRRACRIDAAGDIVAAFEDALGVTSVPAGAFEAEVADMRRRLGNVPMLLAGMAGSNRGWHEAPYARCPADAADLAGAILWVEPGRTGIVPGVCQQAPARADVMRGEEVQVLGAVAAGLVPPDALVCHPGTHAKWITLSGGRIVALRTMMTGEMFALLSRYSILSDLLAGQAVPGDAFLAGVDEALADADLLSALFGIRARHVLGKGSDDAASRASGLLIGCDVRAGLTLADAPTIALIGRPDLCALYAAAIARAGREPAMIDGDAAFRAGIGRLVEML